MAEKISSRYNKFRSLFGNNKDNRIRLFLHELQKEADKESRTKYDDTINFNYESYTPLAMQNKFYQNKLSGDNVNDETIHPEWKFFFGAIAYRLGYKTFTKNSINQIEKDFFNDIDNIKNWRPKSLENLVAAILTKISSFNNDKNFMLNSSEISNIKQVKFLSFSDIYFNLSSFNKDEIMNTTYAKEVINYIQTLISNYSTIGDMTTKAAVANPAGNLTGNLGIFGGAVGLNYGLDFIPDSVPGMPDLGAAANTDDNDDTVYVPTSGKKLSFSIDKYKENSMDLADEIIILYDIFQIKLYSLNPNNTILDKKNELLSRLGQEKNNGKNLSIEPKSLSYLRSKINEIDIDSISHELIWFVKIVNIFKDALIDGPLARNEFSYYINEYFLGEFLEEHVTKSIPMEVSHFWDDDIIPEQQQYYNKDGSLYMKVDGVEVQVDNKSEAFKQLKIEKNCWGTGLKSGEVRQSDGSVITLTCTDFIRDCLLGKNIEKCKEYLKGSSFWVDAEKEIATMLPPIATSMLQSFEFEVEYYFNDTIMRKFKRVKNVDEWLIGINKMTELHPPKLTKEDVKAIGSNTKLLHYLRMLVKKINDNPAILNSNYEGTGPIEITIPSYPRLTAMGVASRNPSFGLSRSVFERLKSEIQKQSNQLAIKFGLPAIYGLQLQGLSQMFNRPTHSIVLKGGNIVDALEDSLAKDYKRIGSILEAHYLGLKNRLNMYNKHIEKHDENKILELIDNLKKTETKLLKAILYTEKYANLLELFEVKDNTSELSLDYLKYFVDARNNYFKKVTQKQDDLLNIFKSIVDAVNKQIPQTSQEIQTAQNDSGLTAKWD